MALIIETGAGLPTMIRTVNPAALAVDLQAARDNLRVDGSDMDSLITGWVKGITRNLEHDVGQCFITQTWEVRMPGLPRAGEKITLPHPAAEIISVKYTDPDGTPVDVPAANLTLSVGRYASSASSAAGAVWPTDGAALVIEVKCGYGDAYEAVPETAQLYILGKLVEQFDPITRMERDTVQSRYLDGLVDDLRCYA